MINTTATLVQQASGTDASNLDCNGNPAPPAQPCFTIDWVENVFRDPTNIYCANCLDWIVQAKNETSSDPNGPVLRLTIGNFANFLTDLGYDINPAPASSMGLSNTGTNTPNQISRSSDGSALRWYFNQTSPNNELMPGQTTVLLAVETNSTRVVPGTISFQGPVTSGEIALGPAIPEVLWVPALGLLGGSAVGAMAFRRRRRR